MLEKKNKFSYFLFQKLYSWGCQMLLRTARCSYVAIIALALHSVILIVGNADSFVTTKRTVCLTGTLCEITILCSNRCSNSYLPKQLRLQVFTDCEVQLKFRKVVFLQGIKAKNRSNQPSEQGENKRNKLNPLIGFESTAWNSLTRLSEISNNYASPISYIVWCCLIWFRFVQLILKD